VKPEYDLSMALPRMSRIDAFRFEYRVYRRRHGFGVFKSIFLSSSKEVQISAVFAAMIIAGVLALLLR
jgi:hypothetical protein